VISTRATKSRRRFPTVPAPSSSKFAQAVLGGPYGRSVGTTATFHIYRGSGYEGHWFRAAKAWDDFVRPIIARATAR